MLLLLLTLHIISASLTSARDCGWPGRPRAGQLVVKRQGFLLPPAPPPKSHPPGDEVEYSCPSPGHTLFGPSTRVCGQDGRWTPSIPLCRSNLSKEGSASQSSEMSNHGPNLAIDGDISTCALTTREDRQRWWQVKLSQPSNITGIRIHLQKENLQAFTVFTIETLASNRTEYKLCTHFNNSATREPRRIDVLSTRLTSVQETDSVAEPRIQVQLVCDQQSNTFGDSVLVRDDRKNSQHMILCEVEVFGEDQPEDKGCGDPELPVGAVTEDFTENQMEISCRPGYALHQDEEPVPAASIHCTKGQWNSSSLACEVLLCPDTVAPEFGRVSTILDEEGREVSARFACNPGYVLWGDVEVYCEDGAWSSSVPDCRILNCGAPPSVNRANTDLVNGTSLVGNIAVYSCNIGYIMVVNASTEPIAQDHTSIVCSEEGLWSVPSNFSCVNAGQLSNSWTGPASVSINMIYCLLALLITLMVPLTLLHCWGRRLCRRIMKKEEQSRDILRSSEQQHQQHEEEMNRSVECSAPQLHLDASPTIGVYNVTAGAVIHPATVNPSTLRSLSSSHNTFKPFSYTHQPVSFNPWTSAFPSPLTPSPAEPRIDESGYAALIIQREPFYEEVPANENTYDDVPRRYSLHQYANTQDLCRETVEALERNSNGSFPDLLEMVTKSKTPSPTVKMKNDVDNTDVGQLYAKVDMEKKRNSRPSSEEAKEPEMDSYTRTLINKFNSFLEESAHV